MKINIKNKNDFNKLREKYDIKNKLIRLSNIKKNKSDIILSNLDNRLNNNIEIIKSNIERQKGLKTHYINLDNALNKKNNYIDIIKLIVTYLLTIYLLNKIGVRYNIQPSISTIIFYSLTLFFSGIIYVKFLVSSR